MTEELKKKAKQLAEFISVNRTNLKLTHGRLSTETKTLSTAATAIGLTSEDDVDKLIFNTKTYLEGSVIYCYEEIPTRITKETFANSFFIFSTTSENYSYFDKNQRKFAHFGTPNTSITQRIDACYYYFRILSALNSPDFCDHHNEANKQLVFYSNSNGILKIKYELEAIIDIQYQEEQISKFEDYSKTNIYKTFLINAFYEIKKGADLISITDLLGELGSINKMVHKNQELASRQFDFETFKKKLYKEKEKYFTTIREVINKIFAQIIGVPISVSASVLASYKVQADDDCTLLLFILAAFIIYTIYFVIIQCTYYTDLKEINSDFNRDFTLIAAESGISESDINYESKKIRKKINAANRLLIFLVSVVALLSIIVTLHLLNQFISCNAGSILDYFSQILKKRL